MIWFLDCLYNFEKRNSQTFGFPYDYQSIMHYNKFMCQRTRGAITISAPYHFMVSCKKIFAKVLFTKLYDLLFISCIFFFIFCIIYGAFVLLFKKYCTLQNIIGIGNDASPIDYYKVCALYNCHYCMGQRFNLAEVVRAVQARAVRIWLVLYKLLKLKFCLNRLYHLIISLIFSFIRYNYYNIDCYHHY